MVLPNFVVFLDALIDLFPVNGQILRGLDANLDLISLSFAQNGYLYVVTDHDRFIGLSSDMSIMLLLFPLGQARIFQGAVGSNPVGGLSTMAESLLV